MRTSKHKTRSTRLGRGSRLRSYFSNSSPGKSQRLVWTATSEMSSPMNRIPPRSSAQSRSVRSQHISPHPTSTTEAILFFWRTFCSRLACSAARCPESRAHSRSTAMCDSALRLTGAYPWSVRARSRMARKPPHSSPRPYSPPRSSRIVGGFLKPRSAGSLPPQRGSPRSAGSRSRCPPRTPADVPAAGSSHPRSGQVRPSPVIKGQHGAEPHRGDETGSLRTPPTAKQSGQSRQGRRRGRVFRPVSGGFAEVGCNTRRAGSAERAAFPVPVSDLDFRGERLRRRLPRGCSVYATVAADGLSVLGDPEKAAARERDVPEPVGGRGLLAA